MGLRSVEGGLSINSRFTLRNALDNSGKISSTNTGLGQINHNLTSGVDGDEVNRVWELINYVLTSGSTITLNLDDFTGWDIGAGAGNDGLGLPMDLEEVVVFQVRHVSGDGKLEVFPAAALGWTPMPSLLDANANALQAGGGFLLYNTGEAGFDVDPGVSEAVSLRAVDADVTLSVLIVGRNDDDSSSSSNSSSSDSSSSDSSSTESSSSSDSSST
jgi:hypothetical protein